MANAVDLSLIKQIYSDVFGADLIPSYPTYQALERANRPSAAIGFRRADAERLFLECYLDQPVELIIGAELNRPIDRRQIVEIGNFAVSDGLAMIGLWGLAANDLAGTSEIAVATLTAPLRKMFARIGVPIQPIAKAHRNAALNNEASDMNRWGSYYEHDPMVCFGDIALGQRAISRFVARRHWRAAA